MLENGLNEKSNTLDRKWLADLRPKYHRLVSDKILNVSILGVNQLRTTIAHLLVVRKLISNHNEMPSPDATIRIPNLLGLLN